MLNLASSTRLQRSYHRDLTPKHIPDSYYEQLEEKMKKYPKKFKFDELEVDEPDDKETKVIKIRHLANMSFSVDSPRRIHKKFAETFSRILIEKMNEFALSSIPGYQEKLKEKIVKYLPDSTRVVRKYGFEACELKNPNVNSRKAQICPWHYELSIRDDRYPFMRLNAVCNCKNCLAKTVFDLDAKKFSLCQQQFTLMPSLIKEKTNQDLEPKWRFAMEEVATSCTCTLRLNQN